MTPEECQPRSSSSKKRDELLTYSPFLVWSVVILGGKADGAPEYPVLSGFIIACSVIHLGRPERASDDVPRQPESPHLPRSPPAMVLEAGAAGCDRPSYTCQTAAR